MRRFGVAALVLVISLSAAAAQEHCAKIKNPDDRLNCYDQSYRVVEPTKKTGEWNVDVEKSRLDDTTTVTMSVRSVDEVRQRFGGSDRGQLIIRCQENTTALYIVWAQHFMADIQGKGRVDYRVDARSASRVSMDESTDNMALGLWNGGKAIPFVKELFGGSELYVRATPFSDSPVEMTFNIAELEEAITPLREACAW